jgi:hypothetical protein
MIGWLSHAPTFIYKRFTAEFENLLSLSVLQTYRIKRNLMSRVCCEYYVVLICIIRYEKLRKNKNVNKVIVIETNIKMKVRYGKELLPQRHPDA